MDWLQVVLVLVISYLMYKIYMKKSMGRCFYSTLLTGKTVLITGASRGIGYEVALDLARRNAKVILACKNKDTGEKAVQKIRQKTGSDKVFLRLVDMSSMESVRSFATEIKREETRLDILINNAGISGHPKVTTKDGLEINMATNHFGPFLLTCLLLDLLKKSAPSRIIVTSSIAHKWGSIKFDNLNAEKSFSQGTIYFDTKLAGVLFTMELHRKLEGSGVTVNCLHPGSVHTRLLDNLPLPVYYIMEVIQTLFFRTPKEGAQTTIYLAVSPELEAVSGKYFSECRRDKSSKKGTDAAVAKKLWEISETITGLK